MPDNVRMAYEGTTFYDGVVNISWGTDGDPEVVAAPAAGRSAKLVGAIVAEGDLVWLSVSNAGSGGKISAGGTMTLAAGWT